MERKCKADESLARAESEGFLFPLGVCPVEPLAPTTGYAVEFEPADGDEGYEDLEEWPDRYVWEVVLSSERVEAFVRSLLAVFPPRVYPIVDYLGQDAFRELDSYVTYDLMGMDRVYEATCLFRDFLFEDGMIGFGVMSEEPFAYLFLDEHKVATVRAEVGLREKVERVLAAFDLREVTELRAVDSVAHEHRSVLTTQGEEDSLTPDQILEQLRDEWGLVLNIEPESNVDDEGRDLGLTWWRCLVRCHRQKGETQYAEVLLAAGHLFEAEQLAIDATSKGRGVPRGGWVEQFPVFADRLTTARLIELLGPTPAKRVAPRGDEKPAEPGIIRTMWIE